MEPFLRCMPMRIESEEQGGKEREREKSSLVN
jgi:hypothetical protein